MLTRLLRRALGRLAGVSFRDHCRAAKRREQEIRSGRGARRRAATYRGLLRLVAQTTGYATAARARVCCVTNQWAESWCTEMGAYLELVARVVDQATRVRRRNGAGRPEAGEPHTDIIVKGGRATEYGHKINLSSGRSGLVLDVVVEEGNPADSTRCLPTLRRHLHLYGEPPQLAAFDGGYASRENLTEARRWGWKHVMFHKKRGLQQTDMTPSAWIYGQLNRFRAGAEAGISYLKRCFGLDRCNWSGWEQFQAYVRSEIMMRSPSRPSTTLYNILVSCP